MKPKPTQPACSGNTKTCQWSSCQGKAGVCALQGVMLPAYTQGMFECPVCSYLFFEDECRVCRILEGEVVA